MKAELAESMKVIAEREANDSPVYTFVKNLKPPELVRTQAAPAVESAQRSG